MGVIGVLFVVSLAGCWRGWGGAGVCRCRGESGRRSVGRAGGRNQGVAAAALLRLSGEGKRPRLRLRGTYCSKHAIFVGMRGIFTSHKVDVDELWSRSQFYLFLV